MKLREFVALAAVAVLGTACSGSGTDGDGTTSGQASGTSKAEPTKEVASAKAAHNYDLVDGEAYGYTPLLTQDQKDAGQVSRALTFLRFAGEKNNVYYLVDEKSNATTVIFCEKPCKYIKVRQLAGGDEETREFETKSIAGSAMTDAQDGKLVPSPSAQSEISDVVDLRAPGT